jgi:hypothetical protein
VLTAAQGRTTSGYAVIQTQLVAQSRQRAGGASRPEVIRREDFARFPHPRLSARPLPLAGEADSARVRRVKVATTSGI